VRLKFVQGFIDKKTGAPYHYFRRPGFKRVRLPGLPGSPEFMQAYEAALANAPIEIGAAKRSKPGSVSAAIASYYASLDFRVLAPGTQVMRRAILENFREKHGDKPMHLMPARFIVAMLDGKKPHAARNWLKALKSLCRHALAHGTIKEDPTAGLKLPRVKDSGGHHTWTEAEIAQFEAHHPIGSKPRLALALLLYTAQRRGDVIRMGPQHVRNGIVSVQQQKTKARLAIPLHPALREILDATPTSHLTYLVTRAGRPYTPCDFSEWFRAQCDAAGLPKRCVGHGLRKAATRRLAEAGCSAPEIAAITGHKTLGEISRYTRGVDQERMAINAMARIANKTVKTDPEV
jgi:integrase